MQTRQTHPKADVLAFWAALRGALSLQRTRTVKPGFNVYGNARTAPMTYNNKAYMVNEDVRLQLLLIVLNV